MKRFNIVIYALALSAAHAHGMELAQPKKKITLNVDQRIKVETRDGEQYLPKADVQLFGTIKNLLQDTKDDAPIPLPKVSGNIMDKMLEDLQWIRQMHTERNNNVAMSDDEIVALSEAERSRRAKIAVQSIQIPEYTKAVLQNEIEYFHGAVFLNNPECIELGAYRVAKLLCSPESMAEFHESDEKNKQKHPLLDEKYRISQDAKSVVHGYMPQEWQDRLALWHNSTVWSVTFSPDGKYLATGSDDRKARIYNIATGEVKEIKHNGWVWSVAFSPDGKYLATGSDKEARIYNIATGELVKEIKHNDWVNSVAFSSDSKYFATGSADNKALIYNVATWKLVKEIGHNGGVNSVAFSPEGKYLATGSNDKKTRIYNIATGEVKEIKHDSWVNSVAFSSDGKYLATGSDDRKARIYNIATGEVKEIKHDSWVRSVAFSSDSKYFATGSADKKARIYNIATWELKEIEHNNWARSVAFSPEGKYFATGSADKKAHVYEYLTNTCDQALLATYLQWCREHNKLIKHRGWVNKIKETYEDTTALEKAFPEKIITLQEFDDQA